ncbi:hypothetical protein [Pseudomonas sp. FG-3G]|nr:hypothetical protein [Pseudomonas sp. FG-3G]
MQLYLHGVMEESDELNHVVSHTIEHDMSRTFDYAMSLFGLLA